MNVRATYTEAERKLALDRMRVTCETFYLAAVATGCHAFVEFAGLMGEFLNVCHDAEEAGHHGWMMANVHGGEPLPMKPFRLGYLREKLSCIYGEALFQRGTDETDTTREAERVLSALALAFVKEPSALPQIVHSIGHVTDEALEAIGQERGEPWLHAQKRRAVDALLRVAGSCEHTAPPEEARLTMFTDALATMAKQGDATLFGRILRTAKEGTAS